MKRVCVFKPTSHNHLRSDQTSTSSITISRITCVFFWQRNHTTSIYLSYIIHTTFNIRHLTIPSLSLSLSVSRTSKQTNQSILIDILFFSIFTNSRSFLLLGVLELNGKNERTNETVMERASKAERNKAKEEM